MIVYMHVTGPLKYMPDCTDQEVQSYFKLLYSPKI